MPHVHIGSSCAGSPEARGAGSASWASPPGPRGSRPASACSSACPGVPGLRGRGARAFTPASASSASPVLDGAGSPALPRDGLRRLVEAEGEEGAPGHERRERGEDGGEWSRRSRPNSGTRWPPRADSRGKENEAPEVLPLSRRTSREREETAAVQGRSISFGALATERQKTAWLKPRPPSEHRGRTSPRVLSARGERGDARGGSLPPVDPRARETLDRAQATAVQTTEFGFPPPGGPSRASTARDLPPRATAPPGRKWRSRSPPLAPLAPHNLTHVNAVRPPLLTQSSDLMTLWR